MNELFVLSELMERPKNGYQLQMSMQNSLGHHRKVSFGVIYPLFNKFEQQGYITIKTVASPKKERIASITEQGRVHFFKLMRDPIPQGAHNDDIFLIKLDAMQHLPIEQQMNLLNDYEREQSSIITETQLVSVYLSKKDTIDHWYANQKLKLRIQQASVTQSWICDFKSALRKRG